MKPFFFILFLMSVNLATAQVPKPGEGKIERLENFPSQFVNPRHIDVWLPNGYTNQKKYKVLYMHDGQMLYDSTITWNKQDWGVDETIQKLINKNEIEEIIVVGIWNNGAWRAAEYFPEKALPYLKDDSLKQMLIDVGLKGKPLADSYLQFLVQELKPFIDQKYSTLSNPSSTFIAGSSMGGLISMYAVCEYPEVFGAAACISTHWPGSILLDDDRIPNAFMQYLTVKIPSPKNHRFYFDYGTENLDSKYKRHQQKVNELFVQKGYSVSNYLSLEFKGADHKEVDWKKRFATPIRFLMQKE